MLDKEKVLEALRASIQNPVAGEALVLRIEAGDFDAQPKKPDPKLVSPREAVEGLRPKGKK